MEDNDITLWINASPLKKYLDFIAKYPAILKLTEEEINILLKKGLKNEHSKES